MECVLCILEVCDFKHLIVAVVVLLIFGLGISTISLSVINKNYESQMTDMQKGTVLAKVNPKEEHPQNSLSIEYQESFPLCM